MKLRLTDHAMMSIEEIEAVPVADWADADCALFLWSTRRNFREGVAVARAWGFEPCGELMWGLRNPGLGTPRALAASPRGNRQRERQAAARPSAH